MLRDLSALGDIPANLKRMDYDANNLKSNRSWHNITYDEWKEYGYKATDVDSMRQAEDASLKAIKEAIAKLTQKYRAAKTP